MTGLVEVTRAGYDQVDAVRSTALKDLAQSSRRAVCKRAETAEMKFGTRCHELILEPVKFARDYVCEPSWQHPWNLGGKRNPRAVEERADWNGAFGHLTQMSASDWDKAHGMRDALRLHPDARALLFEQDGVNERAAFWDDKDWGPCKALIDRWIPDQGRVVDYKTTRDASPRGFQSQAQALKYHVQGAWYMRGVRAVGLDPQWFTIVAQEKTPPFEVAVYTLDREWLAMGERVIDALLPRWRSEVEAGNLEFRQREAAMLLPPAWAEEATQELEKECYEA